MIRCKVEKNQWKGLKATREGLSISHLFFADDLLFFAQADQSNRETIMGTINEFCLISGQQLSLNKSKMFISPNVNSRKAKELSQFCGIGLTKNLDKYLGDPLLHSRVQRGIFNDVLEKVQKKLST